MIRAWLFFAIFLTTACGDLLSDSENGDDFIADLIEGADSADGHASVQGDLVVGGSCANIGEEDGCECSDGSDGYKTCRAGGYGPCVCKAELSASNQGQACFASQCFDVFSLEPTPPAYAYPSPQGGDKRYTAPLAYLDLEHENGNASLSPNFVLKETAQAAKGPYAVVQPRTIDKLQKIRNDLGAIRINSGYRSPHYNKGLGGATYSRHMYGDAFDFTPLSKSLDEGVEACHRAGATFIKKYEFHVHCDWRDLDLEDAFFGASMPWS